MINEISQDFKLIKLIKFTIPSIIMLIFMALYGIVDGVFISRFINTDALSSFNIIYPFINTVIGLGLMLSSGGSAVIAKKLGERKEEEARSNFSFIIIVGFILGIIISFLGYVFSNKIITLLGATKPLFGYCKSYFLVTLIFVPFYILNLLYQMLSITAGKPKMGLVLTVVGGVSNIILDYVFIVYLDYGIVGAALATGIGNFIPVLIGTLFFIKRNKMLYFDKAKVDLHVLKEACQNGSSEMVINLSTGITTMLFNFKLMKYLGSDGVAAMSIVLYGQSLITAIYIGYSSGVAPIISYNYGEQNRKQIKKIIKYSVIFMIAISIISYVISMLIASSIVEIFTPKGSKVYDIGYKGFIIFATSFLITGINIFASSMFTAFSNGKVSAIISFLRTFVFLIGSIFILPEIFNTVGIWISVPIAEILTIIVSIMYMRKYRIIYGY